MDETTTDTSAPQTGAPDAQDDGDALLAGDLARLLDEEESDQSARDLAQAEGPDDEDSSDEDPQPRQAEDAKEEPKPEPDADPEVVVKVDGQERRIKQSELIASYQKGEASSKRFEEAAAQRRTLDQERAQVAAERQQLQQALAHFTNQIQQQAPAQPDPALLDADPVAYLRQRAAFDAWSDQRQQAMAAQAHLARQQQAESEHATRQQLLQEAHRLVDALPEWRDASKAEAGRQAIRAHLLDAGFTDAEVGAITDHRVVLLTREAMLYRQMVAEQKAAAAKATEKLQKLPPPRMAAPGSGETNPTDGRTRAMKRLAATGDVEDAAAVLATFL